MTALSNRTPLQSRTEPLARQAAPPLAPKRFVQPLNPLKVDEALERFRAPDTAAKIQILRPFAVFSAKAYSTAATLPIGPAYLAAVLEAAGYPVDIIDGLGEGIMNVRTSPCGLYTFQGLTTSEIIDRIDPAARILGVSMMFSQNWIQNRDLIRAIRAARPDITVIVGGEHPTALPEYVLRDCPEIDYLVTGEGELILLELVHRILRGATAHDIPGVSYLDAEGVYVNNGLGRRLSDFQNLPWPAWHLCRTENFFTGMWSMGIGYGRNMLILATRGCPYQCTFCSNPTMWTTRYLMRPVNDVVDEIEHLIRTYRCNSIDFADLTAIVKKDWILEFCSELKRRRISVAWQLPSGTRSEALDADTLRAIHEAGCRFLVYAPESGSLETLERIKKRVDLDNIVKSIGHAVTFGHTVKAALIIGFPHERRRDIIKTLWFAVRLAYNGIADCNISPFSPYPGSELFEELRQKKVIPQLDDAYFKSLVGQFDFTSTKNYCERVPGWEIALYRFLGMSAFYALSYIFRPARFVRLGGCLLKGDFQPQSLFEQRIYDWIGRMRLNRSVS